MKREDSHGDERALTVIAEAAAAINPGAEQAAVVTLGSGHSGLAVRAWHGDLPGQLIEAKTDTGQDLCTDALTRLTTIRRTDLHHEQRWPMYIGQAADSSVRSVLCTPLMLQDQMFGCLTLSGTMTNAFDENTEVLAAVFAGHAALALLGLADFDTCKPWRQVATSSVEPREC